MSSVPGNCGVTKPFCQEESANEKYSEKLNAVFYVIILCQKLEYSMLNMTACG